MGKYKRHLYIISYYFLITALLIIFSEEKIKQILVLSVFLALSLKEVYVLFKKLDKENKYTIHKMKEEVNKHKGKNKREKNRFISLIETMGSGLILVDIDGKIKYYNKDFLLMFGDKDYEGKYFQKVITVKPLNKFISSAYLLEKKIRDQIIYKNNIFEIISTPLFENGYFIGCIILIHDITLLKQAESMQKSFIADASHELRTPITSIKGMTELILRDQDMDESVKRDFLNHIYIESNRIEEIVVDLLNMSKLERINHELDYLNVSLKELVQEVIKPLYTKVNLKPIELINDADDIQVKIDKNLFYRVLSNLIKNAISYTDEGSVTISTEDKEGEILIHVKDTGIGISKKELPKVFDRFYRVDKARSRDTGGTGLGLSICKKIVERHNGYISIESEIEKGTTFTIHLLKDENSVD